jgi:hypothetical protein
MATGDLQIAPFVWQRTEAARRSADNSSSMDITCKPRIRHRLSALPYSHASRNPHRRTVRTMNGTPEHRHSLKYGLLKQGDRIAIHDWEDEGGQ